jgi:hypothetical protein
MMPANLAVVADDENGRRCWRALHRLQFLFDISVYSVGKIAVIPKDSNTLI